MPLRKGINLHYRDISKVLNSYVHRFTGDHKPSWTDKDTPLQFLNDREWLMFTEFHVKVNGRLDNRYKSCESYPTWPNNPELRKYQ